jgi:outer membrane protein assembly factor BamA
VKIGIENVFDPNVPGEHFWPYRLANRLHIRTRASVIREALLFHPGETVQEPLLEETERNLRALPFVKDAKITEVSVNQTDVDLIVKTQDAWTTQPQINFGSEGGKSHFSTGILEENLLGYGKSFSYFYKKEDLEGISHQFSYSDPQLFHTRTTLSTLFEDIPTGNHQSIGLARPFYSLETPVAGGINFDRSMSLHKVLERGQETTRYNQDHLDVGPYGGVRLNSDLLNVQRLILRYRYTETISRETTGTTPGSLPRNQTLSGPILTWTLQQSDFIKEHFIDTAERTEDINLGHVTSAGTGYSGRVIGATQNSVPFTLLDSFGFGADNPWFGLFSYGTSGRYNLYADDQVGGRLVNTLYFANANFYRHWPTAFPMTGVAHAEAAHLQNPDTSNLLSIGGSTGLRGFKVDAFTGNKTILVNLENRFYYPYEILHLAYLGGAMFCDAGQAQPQGTGFTMADFRANVGVGFRAALSRSTEGTVFRIDLAYAIGQIQQNNRWILSISSGMGFKRNGNTYSKFVGVPNGS